MASRSTRAQIARETLGLLDARSYRSPSGQSIDFGAALAAARSASVLVRPADFETIFHRCEQRLQTLRQARGSSGSTRFEVVNETTLHAARRLVEREAEQQMLALNFASARHPGGGFLNGSQAQEESLARASGLYACIAPHQAMYEANARAGSCLYTDHMIYSPNVPVFRDDDDTLLESPYLLSFVTAPAVNVGAVRANTPELLPQVETVMRDRMARILSLAVLHEQEVLILGAWGCGVFRNDPEQVARWFHDHLCGDGRFRDAFRRVLFAVLDRTETHSTVEPFERHFGKA